MPNVKKLHSPITAFIQSYTAWKEGKDNISILQNIYIYIIEIRVWY